MSGTVFGDTTDFRWENNYNGCYYPAIDVSFSNGYFYGFLDNRGIYKIGDPTVEISEQQATQKALNAIKDYSYEMPGGVWISNFNINQTNAKLTPILRNVYYLYPCWTVSLYTDKTYPGSVHGFMVSLWAGTGEVFQISNIAYG